MEGFYRKEGGTRKLKEWIISGRTYQVDSLIGLDEEIPDWLV